MHDSPNVNKEISGDYKNVKNVFVNQQPNSNPNEQNILIKDREESKETANTYSLPQDSSLENLNTRSNKDNEEKEEEK